jgi:glycosyltransferase involved in cell wall biosynthesis
MLNYELPIIYVSPYYDPKVYSGGNRRMGELISRFQREYGEKFTLVVTKGKAPEGWGGKLVEVNYDFNHVSKFSAANEIGQFLESQPLSIVILESVPIPFSALKKHVHFQVAYDFRYFTGDSKGFLYRLAFSQYLKNQWQRSQFMVTCSDFSIAELKKYVGYDPSKVVKSFFGIDERVLDIAKEPMPAKEYDIIYVAHYEKRKNHEPLIRAIAEIDKNLKVFFLGRDNGLELSLKNLCRELALKNVVFSDPVDDKTLWQTYRKSRVLANPSLYEGFGIPTIEALALGIPAVISDIPVYHEVGADLVTYFDPNDPNDIARKLRDRLADNAVPPPEKVRAHLAQFFWENIYKKFVDDLNAFAGKAGQ